MIAINGFTDGTLEHQFGTCSKWKVSLKFQTHLYKGFYNKMLQKLVWNLLGTWNIFPP